MVLRVNGLSKSYPQGDGTSLHVLSGLDINVAEKQTVAVMGESGCGKTTFLNCITGLDRFNDGTVLVCDQDINGLGDKDLSELRNKNLGFVFQFHYLLKDFSVKENVMMPCLIAGLSPRTAEEKTLTILKKIRLSDKADSFPRQLSGGEQQR
ncbi:MAG: ATP-binding cassette domain-containing protein, partial [Pseudomonadota bacterium]